MLKAGALKFFTMFWNQISKPIAMALLPDVIRFLGAESNVVHSYAASCIETFLLVEDEGGRARYTAADVSLFLLALMTSPFTALQKPESEENQYVMKCIIRVLGVANVSHEDPSLISSFETSLLPSLQMILSRDVSEFFPYAFQLLAQLVDLNGSPVTGNIMEIFAILLLPESWKKSANVLALVDCSRHSSEKHRMS
ncbi:UNVERIFIED_CONTAM: Exportin-2 [Sesamum latifolium]|uniref:Exportin-2 n=1 Tax=Sesamum latifolium TaxID=2727402 RepID=A0AAW2U5N4_9LAMI